MTRLKKISTLLITLIPFILLSEDPHEISTEENTHPIASLNCEPSGIVNNCVNVITGDFLDFQTDLVVPGSEPIVFRRQYMSSFEEKGSLCHGWNINHFGQIHFVEGSEEKKAQVFENGGVPVTYKLKSKKTFKIDKDILKNSITNCASGVIGACTNLKNGMLKGKHSGAEVSLTAPSGELSIYRYRPPSSRERREGVIPFEIKRQEKLSGNTFDYYHNEPNQLESVSANGLDGCCFGFVDVTYEEKQHRKYREAKIRLKSSTGKKIKYTLIRQKSKDKKGKHRYLLTEVKRSDAPKQFYLYEEEGLGHLERISEIRRPLNRFLEVKYIKKGFYRAFDESMTINVKTDARFGKVRILSAPVGTDATPYVTHHFIYKLDDKHKKKTGGSTHVYDAYGHRTDYCYNRHNRLDEVRKFEGTETQTLYSTEKIIWGKKKQNSYLLGRTFKDGDDNVIFHRYFHYDDFGNIKEDFLRGNLTGQNSEDSYQKSFTYTNDGLNLMSSYDDGRKKNAYEYLPETNLLCKELTYDGDQIKLRKFYHYNIHGIMEKEIVDDGVTVEEGNLTGVSQRVIKEMDIRTSIPTGVPNAVIHKCVDLKTGEEILIKKIEYSYNIDGKITNKKIYGSDGVLAATESAEYNAQGNVIRSVNALGQVSTYKYCVLGNLIEERGPDLSHYKTFVYDFSDRLIAEKIIKPGKDPLVTSYQYDYLGNKIASIDPYGNETNYTYDSFNRLIATIFPAVKDLDGLGIRPVQISGWDHMSYQSEKTDTNGVTETTAFTVRGTPYLKTFADGTQEKHTYHPDGTLETQTSQTGVLTQYTTDFQGRVTLEEVFTPTGELVETRSREYNAFHLLREVDPEGIVTEYTYYPDGKKRSCRIGDSLILYEYDALGRDYKTIEYFGSSESDYSVEVKEYDVLDRVIEERTEDASENILRQKTYVYDSRGNKVEEKTLTESGFATNYKRFDHLNRLIHAVDSLGNVTVTTYNDHYLNGLGQRVLLEETTAADGTVVSKEHDALGRVIRVEYHDTMGTVLRTECTDFDLAGNKVRFTHGDQTKQVVSSWEYDCMNRVIGQTEAVGTYDQKYTTTAYNQYGQKEIVTKSDGIQIHYRYDWKNRLSAYYASDQTFSYEYDYDRNDNPVEVIDHLYGTITKKEYDDKGVLVSETLGNGLNTTFVHDRMGRPSKVTLPDGTGVAYTYDAAQLKSVTRLDECGQEQYCHHYTKSNLYGLPEKIQLTGSAGELTNTYDALGRLVSSKGEHWSEMLSYDNVGNLIERKVSISGEEKTHAFNYDPLKRLVTEDSYAKHRYQYDALHNRVSKDEARYDLNDLNQVTFDGENTYHYDLNGNMIAINGLAGDCEYRYDALDRLVYVKTPEERVYYRYDEMNRRLEKNVEGDGSVVVERYMYQGQDEVGVVDETGTIVQLRLLGFGKGAEIGASVAMELEGKVYVPINDQQGNISLLVDAETGAVADVYCYSSFGEEVGGSEGLSPWRFSGKRYDEETGFIYFGRRYYAPWLGKWITPDPAGHNGGPNLYAYVDNAPLTKFDLYGLYAQHSQASNSSGAFTVFGHGISCWSGWFVGGLLQMIGDHMLPIPFVRDAFSYTGHMIQTGNHESYVRSDRQMHSQNWTVCGSFNHPGVQYSFGNGIVTTREEALDRGVRLSEALGGASIGTCYNATHGIFSDVFETIAQKLRIPTYAVRMRVADLRTRVRLAGGVGSGGMVVAGAHSQGGTILAHALEYLSPEERSMIHVVTFGSATIISPDGLASAMNFISSNDGVGLLVDPFARAKGFRERYVRYVRPNQCFPINHSFESVYFEPCIKYINDLLVDKGVIM